MAAGMWKIEAFVMVVVAMVGVVIADMIADGNQKNYINNDVNGVGHLNNPLNLSCH